MIWRVWGRRQDGTPVLLAEKYKEEAAETRLKEARESRKYESVWVQTVEVR